MKSQPLQKKKPLAQQKAEQESQEGKSLNPPAFQLKAGNGAAQPVQQKAATGALPGDLVNGFAASTGHDLSDVKVHQNSDKPAQVGALAYAQGNDIHLGAGQEKHLAHEAAHIVQQREGKVQANTQVAGMPVNDSKSLESEADSMGAKAAQMKADKDSIELGNLKTQQPAAPLQAKVAQCWPPKATTHLKDQAVTRGISEAEVDAAFATGTKYNDPDYPKGIVYFNPATGVAVCTMEDGAVTTCYRRANPKPKWTLL